MSGRLEDWLPPLPIGWGLKPFFSVFKERNQPNEGLQVETVLSLSYGRIVERDVESNHGLLPASFEGYNIVEPEDIVMRLTDLQNDQRSLRTAQVEQRGVITSAYVTVTPQTSLHKRFAHYLLHGYDLAKLFYRMGGGLRQSMKFDDLKRMPVVLPPLDIQERIANFLDDQTARIDALIAEKERLTQLIAEYRQSWLSQVLTRAERVRRIRLKFCLRSPLQYGVNESGNYDATGPRYIRITDITSDGNLSNDDVKFLTPNQASGYELFDGDVLFARSGATVGKSFVYREDMGPAAFAGYLIRAQLNRQLLLTDFLRLLTETHQYWEFIRSAETQSTIQNASAEKLANYEMNLPDVQSQESLLFEIEPKIALMDKLVAHVGTHLESLRKYRSSLISAAVTGQLDISAFKINLPKASC